MIIILKIGLYGRNKRYLEKLAHFLEEDLRLQLFIFTKEEELKKFVNSQKLDSLIMDEIELESKITINKIIYLSNEEGQEASNIIYKYQSSRYIRAQLLKILKIESFKNITNFSCKVIGVYSPVSNSFKTSLAVLLGYQGLDIENTLLLTLDRFSLLDCNKNYDEIYDFSDLLYCLEQGRCDDSVFERAIGCLSELPYIYPLIMPEDIQKITVSQMEQFIKKISDKYQRLIIDIGNDVENVIEFLDLCQIIYIPIVEDFYTNQKINYFENYLKGRQRMDILDKIQKINIPSRLLTRQQWNVNYYNELKWCDFKICN